MLASENNYISEASDTIFRLSAEKDSLIQELRHEIEILKTGTGNTHSL